MDDDNVVLESYDVSYCIRIYCNLKKKISNIFQVCTRDNPRQQMIIKASFLQNGETSSQLDKEC